MQQKESKILYGNPPVLLPVSPRLCNQLIAGTVSATIRRTRPKRLGLNFRSYLYCSGKNTTDPHQILELHTVDNRILKMNGHIVGECDCHVEFLEQISGQISNRFFIQGKGEGYIENLLSYRLGMGYRNVRHYLGVKNGYVWNLQNIVVYDKPITIEECLRRKQSGQPSDWRYTGF